MIASASRLLRQRLRRVLKRENDIQVASEAVSGSRLLAMVESLQPVDILLIDDQLIRTEGLGLLTEVHVKSPETKMLIMGGLSKGSYLIQALLYGVRGFILKTVQDCVYIKALHTLHAGDLWVERKVLAQVLEDFLQRGGHLSQPLQGSWEDLTPREQEIIALIGQGMTNKEIAKDLGISDKTIKTHLSRIFAKLKISRRIQLVLQSSLTKKD